MFQRFCFLALSILMFQAVTTYGQLRSPDEFFPHQVGEAFTLHHQLVDYFEHAAENSEQVIVEQYGTSNEGRPLLAAFISTPENLARLEEIRLNHLRKTGLVEGEVNREERMAIVWLSCSVHGNEAAGAEASPTMLYELANTDNKQTQEWLENTIVILDPVLNPDGFSRYVNWYKMAANRIPNPNQASREHREPWPGGRSNHYYFDLNRDWVWATQKETRQRLELYKEWMPHIHADIHEQGINSPYYFAPAAQPYHEYITKFQGDFQNDIGRNHAKYFDKNNWLYFTKEVFDLLYPSYGDTYPTFNGAIGMTYEQGGSGRAGREVLLANGDTLSLKDRVAHHTATALSTVEIASKNAVRLNRNFEKYFRDAQSNPVGNYNTFVIKANTPYHKLKTLTTLLDRHQIRYGRAGTGKTVLGYSYQNGRTASVNISDNDLIISAYQPKGTLVQVLFEPEAKVVDSLTYDITAWSLPHAHGLEAYALNEQIEVAQPFALADYQLPQNKEQAYAYAAKWESVGNAKFLSELLKKGIKVRSAAGQSNFNGENFGSGTLIITSADNRKMKDFHQIVLKVAEQTEQELTPIESGLADGGSDLGSGAYQLIDAPNVAIIQDDNTASLNFGQLWYYFEQDLNYPVSIIRSSDLNRLLYYDYDVVIMPEGRYALDETKLKTINNWTKAGGNFIVIGSAMKNVAGRTGFKLSKSNGNGTKNNQNVSSLAERTQTYADRQRSSISNQIPGAIYKINMDNTHPLGFGMPNYYFSLKASADKYDLLKDSWNVGYIDNNPLSLGFIGANAKANMRNTVVFAVTDRGRGKTIYMVDNPLYRGFWEQGKFLFSNALFQLN